MTYRQLKGVFKRTKTVPTWYTYAREYPKVCLNAALTIEKKGYTEEFLKGRPFGIRSEEFVSFEYGLEGCEYNSWLNKKEYNMGLRLRKDLLGETP